MELKRISPNELTLRPFYTLDKQWALLTAGDRARFNTMTVSWGGLGTLWNKPVATVYVRPQRYTYEFTERSEYFTLSFFGGNFMDDLQYLGSHSGRDGNKLSKTCLTPAFDAETAAPYIAEASCVLVLRKLYHDDIKPERFDDSSIIDSVYPAHDFHRVYICEVIAAYAKN